MDNKISNHELIDGYEILEYIGKGSFGTVYKCKKNEEIYAMKVFLSDYIYSEYSKDGSNRIIKEIQALKSVDSKYVLKYIDDGSYVENAFKYYYVITDFVDGMNLEEYLEVKKLSVSEVITIFTAILKGVEAIHKCRIVHRDLKPENISIDSIGNIKILDFGLSKLIDFTTITSTGQTIGTPLFMSPEQVKDSKNIDYRSDYYSLGVILFYLLTKKYPYGKIASLHELYYKILNEAPISVRYYLATIPNSIDNLILNLLKKKNFERPNTISAIQNYLVFNNYENEKKDVELEFIPSYYVRLWNEKTVFNEFYEQGYSIENVIFPINHQTRQNGLLKFIKKKNMNVIIDPSTMRLAYDTFSEVKGLRDLPYSPKNLTKLEISHLFDYGRKRTYVEQVVNEQIKNGANSIVSPFHVSNNSSLARIKMDDDENWFSLDIKLFNETKDYLNEIKFKGDIVCGICIKTDILTTESEKEYFLNTLSRVDADKYWIYVDCIDNNSNLSQLYNYADALLELQKSSNKPVIAGRIGNFGLVLLAFGLYAFESGVARFESFMKIYIKKLAMHIICM